MLIISSSSSSSSVWLLYCVLLEPQRQPLSTLHDTSYMTFAYILHWLDSQADGMRTVHLGSPALSAAALKAVLVFMYTERLDVGIEEVDPVLRVMRKCRLKHMVPCVQKERRTLRYHSKSVRKDEAGPRRSAAAALYAHAVMQCCAYLGSAKQACIDRDFGPCCTSAHAAVLPMLPFLPMLHFLLML